MAEVKSTDGLLATLNDAVVDLTAELAALRATLVEQGERGRLAADELQVKLEGLTEAIETANAVNAVEAPAA